MTPLAPLVTAFFRQHLAVEKGVSKNTIASYSYAFKFLCGHVSGRLGTSPSQLSLEDLDAPMVRDFLEHLERDGGNTARTRNLRLTAIRSFMKYVEYEVPSALEQARMILAISSKRTEERLVNHLTKEEMRAILDAPDPTREAASETRPCSISVSLLGSASRSWLVSASTTSNSTGRIQASSSGGRVDSNVVSRAGKRRRGHFAPGWPSAVAPLSPRSS